MSTPTLRYDFTINPALENNTHAKLLRAVGSGKRVLDVGCASGYLSEHLLRHQGCDVTGLEPDSDAAAVAKERLGDRVVQGGTELLPSFPAGSFDVVMYADVLEHLTDPADAVRESRRLLAPGGYLVVSLPNVAHGDVRLLLLGGQFPYRRTGLLDSTHIRFFTRHSIPSFFARSGYWVTEMSAMTVPVGASELAHEIGLVNAAVLSAVRADPTAEDYQYVLRAEPDRLSSSTSYWAGPRWEGGRLVRLWAHAFSPVEPVRLALPVADDDTAVDAAVSVVERQCREAGTTSEQVADIELVRTDNPLLPDGWVAVDDSWTVARLRSVALPPGDVFVD